ncbi:PTS beta-glucoside transporter subunit EIIBCA [Rothia nasimurium]|uniref:PTS beta-glucoside transporter subunit EIIBCA n=1 Tax=Rothia nasimurium TaxID=85336 RepID=A0A1Y1RNB9_9MICC|nr:MULTISPECIES: glucose PTS transporter subunit IIA [Rothia]ORC16100.1 PTS beta-glucoside transporter subunit EIIBCA [Rothia nasimurium]
MNNSQMGEQILEGLGGPENISHFTHCATRLRVTPKSNSAIDRTKIENVPGVLSIIEQSGQTQVVLGDKVESVYNEMLKLPGMSNVGDNASKNAAEGEKKAGVLTRVFDVLSDSFRPILWALLGTSMILTLIVFLQQLGYFGQYTDLTGQTVNIDIVNGPRLADADAAAAMLNEWRAAFPFWFLMLAAALSVLNFMPIMIGATAAKRLGANMWVGAAIPAALMTSTFQGFSDIAVDGAVNVPFLGLNLPLYVMNYTGQIFPPLFAAALLAPLERLLKKIIPTMLHMVFVPMISVMVLVPLTAFVIGPIGINFALAISDFIGGVNESLPWLVGGLIAGLYLFMVPLGLHWPLNAVMINNLQTDGVDFIQSPMGAYNFAVFGVVTGVAIAARRNKELRQTAVGAAASGLLGGISEPSLYGVVLRYKRVFPLILVPAVIGGATISALGVQSHAFAFTSLLSIPAMQPSHLYMIGLAIAYFGALAGVLIFGYESKDQKAEAVAVAETGIGESEAEATTPGTAEKRTAAGAASAAAAPVAVAQKQDAAPWSTEETSAPTPGSVLTIASPLEGQAVPLTETPDPIFAAEKLGKGAAIVPTGNTVVAPAAGKVSVTMPSGHAIGLKLDSGVELLIHVGIDTVNLNGKGFDVKVEKGQRVAAGDLLMTFDPEIIKNAGYSLVTPVLVTNTGRFAKVEGAVGEALPGSELIKVTTK